MDQILDDVLVEDSNKNQLPDNGKEVKDVIQIQSHERNNDLS